MAKYTATLLAPRGKHGTIARGEICVPIRHKGELGGMLAATARLLNALAAPGCSEAARDTELTQFASAAQNYWRAHNGNPTCSALPGGGAFDIHVGADLEAGLVRLEFRRTIDWLTLLPGVARELAGLLLRAADAAAQKSPAPGELGPATSVASKS